MEKKISSSLWGEGQTCPYTCPFWALMARVARATVRGEGKG